MIVVQFWFGSHPRRSVSLLSFYQQELVRKLLSYNIISVLIYGGNELKYRVFSLKPNPIYILRKSVFKRIFGTPAFFTVNPQFVCTVVLSVNFI